LLNIVSEQHELVYDSVKWHTYIMDLVIKEGFVNI